MIHTTHIQKMIRSALSVAERSNNSDTTEHERVWLEGAVNKLRHAAAELEAEILEHYERIPQD